MTTIVPLAGSGLLFVAIIIMTVGLTLGILGYRLWQWRRAKVRIPGRSMAAEAPMRSGEYIR